MSVKLILLVIAAICFGLKAFSVNAGRVDFMNLGFMFVVLSVIIS